MSLTTFFRHLIAASAMGLAASAHAGWPLVSEDAGVLDRAGCELETAALRLGVAGAGATERGLGTSCGVGWRSQIGLGVSRTSGAGPREDGLSLGGKTALWRGGDADDAPALTLAWGLGWSKPAGSRWQRASTALNLAYSRALNEQLTLHANLGHARDHQGQGVATTWAMALEHAAWPLASLHWAPMAELFGDDHGAPWWSAGLRLTLVPDSVSVGLSHGRQMDGAGARLSTLSLKIGF